DAYVAGMPHLQWVDFDNHGYNVVDITPECVVVEWWAGDPVLSRHVCARQSSPLTRQPCPRRPGRRPTARLRRDADLPCAARDPRPPPAGDRAVDAPPAAPPPPP